MPHSRACDQLTSLLNDCEDWRKSLGTRSECEERTSKEHKPYVYVADARNAEPKPPSLKT